MKRRPVDIVVISDVHLGTHGCRAKELVEYLKSIAPKRVILNGNIIDIRQFNKRYWPKSHMKVLKILMNWVSKGIKMHYLIGNHDEMLRKYLSFQLGSFSIANELVLPIHAKKAWFYHGDVYDVMKQHSKSFINARTQKFNLLLFINKVVNLCSAKIGREPISMSEKVKKGAASTVKFITAFEQTAAEIAVMNRCDYVICGHIHTPEIKTIVTSKGSVTYLNSGDWVDNLSALEYVKGKWRLYRYKDDIKLNTYNVEVEDPIELLEKEELFERMMSEFKNDNRTGASHSASKSK